MYEILDFKFPDCQYIFLKVLIMSKREKMREERAHAVEEGAERARTPKLPIEHGTQHRAQSHHP